LRKPLALWLSRDKIDSRLDVSLREARSVLHGDELVVDPENGWGADFQVEVRGTSLND
jgi:hypothetical protein